MTNNQKTAFDKALTNLKKSGLKAVRATSKGNKPVYLVLNRSASKNAGYPVYHLVYRDINQCDRFVCDCKYGRKAGNACVHKMAAFVAEETARKAATKAAIEKKIAASETLMANSQKLYNAITGSGQSDDDRAAWLPVPAKQQGPHLYRH
jgi:hypothetical protein